MRFLGNGPKMQCEQHFWYKTMEDHLRYALEYERVGMWKTRDTALSTAIKAEAKWLQCLSSSDTMCSCGNSNFTMQK